MTSPALEWGQVVIQGNRILEIRTGDPSRADENLGETILTPALVNAHTHLDLSGFPRHTEIKMDFLEWVEGVMAFRNGRGPEQIQSDIQSGIEQSLRCGVGLVGDISAGGKSWEALAASPLAGVVYFELLGLREPRASQFWNALKDWQNPRRDLLRLKRGISPHAPYSVRLETVSKAVQSGMPLQMHLAETTLEVELFRRNAGRLKDWLVDKDVFDLEGLATSLQRICDELCLNSKAAMVHGTCLESPFLGHSSLVYCPRTTDFFAQADHPFLKMREAGWRVALGTDSLASNPDLNVLAEARCLKKKHPMLPSFELLEMITIRGAELLGMQNDLGSLESGKFADMALFPLTEDTTLSPEDFLLTKNPDCQGLILGGKWVFHFRSGWMSKKRGMEP